MKEVKVSQYSNFRDRKSQRVVNLFTFFDDPQLQEYIEYIRTFYHTDKEKYNENKAILPCITPSGRFSRRKASELIEHSGYICLDIDAGDNTDIKDFAELRDEISKLSNVAYCSLSLSRNGVFCFIPIKYPEKHKEHFYALRYCFEKLGIIIDKSCSDVSRLRALSYDPDRYINYDAVVFETTMDKKLLDGSSPDKRRNDSSKNRDYVRTVRKAKSIDTVSANFSKVQKTISILSEKGLVIAESYADWFSIGCAFASEFGEDGRDFFHNVSSMSSKYHEAQTDGMYNSCLDGCLNMKGYSIGTFYYLAKKQLTK